MIHHVSVGTNDLQKSARFYDPVMKHLGLRRMYEDERSIAYGATEFTFSIETPVNGQPATAGNGVHIAFAAQDRSMVDKFFEIGLVNGGSADGPPGIRPNYDDHYYAAFLLDPDGNKIELVTFFSK